MATTQAEIPSAQITAINMAREKLAPTKPFVAAIRKHPSAQKLGKDPADVLFSAGNNKEARQIYKDVLKNFSMNEPLHVETLANSLLNEAEILDLDAERLHGPQAAECQQQLLKSLVELTSSDAVQKVTAQLREKARGLVATPIHESKSIDSLSSLSGGHVDDVKSASPRPSDATTPRASLVPLTVAEVHAVLRKADVPKAHKVVLVSLMEANFKYNHLQDLNIILPNAPLGIYTFVPTIVGTAVRFKALQAVAKEFAAKAIKATESYLSFMLSAQQQAMTEREASQALFLQQQSLEMDKAQAVAASEEAAAAAMAHDAAIEILKKTSQFVSDFKDTWRAELEQWDSWQTYFGLYATGHMVTRDEVLEKNIPGIQDPGDDIPQDVLAHQIAVLRNRVGMEMQQQQYEIQEQRERDQVTAAYQARMAAERRREHANEAVELAQMRLDFMQSNKLYIENQEISSDTLFQYGHLMKNLVRRYVERAQAVAIAMQRAYNQEYLDDVSVIETNYQTKYGLNAAEELSYDIESITNRLAQRTNKDQPFLMEVSLAREYSFALQTLRSTGTCSIFVDIERIKRLYPGIYGVRIQTVSVVPVGAVGDKGLVGQLSCGGSSTIRSVADKPVTTNHPRETLLLSAYQLEANGGFIRMDDEQRNIFEMLGVGTSWELKLPLAHNELTVSRLADIRLRFYCYARFSPELFAKDKAAAPVWQTASATFSIKSDFAPDAFYQLATTGSFQFAIDPAFLPASVVQPEVRQLRVVTFPAQQVLAELRVPPNGGVVNIKTEPGSGSGLMMFVGPPQPLLGEYTITLAPERNPQLDARLADPETDAALKLSGAVADILLIVDYRYVAAAQDAWQYARLGDGVNLLNLLKRGLPANIIDISGKSLLYWACTNGMEQVFDYIVQNATGPASPYRVDINDPKHQALLQAVSGKRLSIVKKLLALPGYDVYLQGPAALYQFCAVCDLEPALGTRGKPITPQLVGANATLAPLLTTLVTAMMAKVDRLMAAVQRAASSTAGETELLGLVRVLPRAWNQEIVALQDDHFTLLRVCARYGFLEVARILVQLPGFDINNPLHNVLIEALNKGWSPIVTFALENHVSVSPYCYQALTQVTALLTTPPPQEPVTPTLTAAREAIRQSLLQHIRAEPTVQTFFQQISHGTEAAVALVVPQLVGASPFIITDENGYTPLNIVARRGFANAITILLDLGADVNQKIHDALRAAMVTNTLPPVAAVLARFTDVETLNAVLTEAEMRADVDPAIVQALRQKAAQLQNVG